MRAPDFNTRMEMPERTLRQRINHKKMVRYFTQ